MATNSRIEWTDATWPVITGCSPVSAGCANCYAARLASGRLRHLHAYHGLARADKWTGEVRFNQDMLDLPLSWKRPRKIFVCPTGDLFHEGVDAAWLYTIFDVMDKCRRHTFILLTKRPERIIPLLYEGQPIVRYFRDGDHLPNVWIGTSVENRQTADERIPKLLDIPAAVRFISAEPLLGPIQFRISHSPFRLPDWVICGGESGPKARPMHPDWARSLRDQCQAASIPFFFKQWGEWGPDGGEARDEGRRAKDASFLHPPSSFGLVRLGKRRAGRLLDGVEWSEFPGAASDQ